MHACMQQYWSSNNMQAGITIQFTEFRKIACSSELDHACMRLAGWLVVKNNNNNTDVRIVASNVLRDG